MAMAMAVATTVAMAVTATATAAADDDVADGSDIRAAIYNLTADTGSYTRGLSGRQPVFGKAVDRTGVVVQAAKWGKEQVQTNYLLCACMVVSATCDSSHLVVVGCRHSRRASFARSIASSFISIEGIQTETVRAAFTSAARAAASPSARNHHIRRLTFTTTTNTTTTTFDRLRPFLGASPSSSPIYQGQY